MDKISATVILYNPENDIVDNIRSYINYIDKLYIVDNSTIDNKDLVLLLKETFTNIEYINNNENLGVATALNIGCSKAIEDNFNWILTMDQDSSFYDFEKYLKCFENIKDKADISVISPNPFIKTSGDNIDCIQTEKTITLTSGSLLNLTYFEKLGGFCEKLFIDEVDHDYCLRSIENNLKVLEFSNILLKHTIGEYKQTAKKRKTAYYCPGIARHS